MDITYRTDYGILEIKPAGVLKEKDFQNLATEIKSLRETDRELKGILIRTKDFPGYEKFADALAHGEFLKEQHDQIQKVALCTDSAAGRVLEAIGKILTEAEAKKFGYDEKDEAEKWLLAG